MLTKTEKLIEKVLKLDAIYDDPESSDAAALEAEAGLAVRAATLAIALRKALEAITHTVPYGCLEGIRCAACVRLKEIDDIVEGK